MNIYDPNIAEARTRPIKLSHFEVGAPAKANFFFLSETKLDCKIHTEGKKMYKLSFGYVQRC